MRRHGRRTAACVLVSFMTLTLPSDARADWLIGVYMGAAGTNLEHADGHADKRAGVGDRRRGVRREGVRVAALTMAVGSAGYLVAPGGGPSRPRSSSPTRRPSPNSTPPLRTSARFNSRTGSTSCSPTSPTGRRPAAPRAAPYVVRGGGGISNPPCGVNVSRPAPGAVSVRRRRLAAGRRRGVPALAQHSCAGGRPGGAPVSETHLHGASADISGAFVTRHVDFGLAVRIGKQCRTQ